MGRLVVACPMAKEADALRKQLPGREVLSTGLGIKRTLPALLRVFREGRPDVLIFTGSVGQLDLRLKMSDVVYTSTWCFEEGQPCFETDREVLRRIDRLGLEWTGKGLTLHQPVMKAQARQEYHQRTNASVYDSVTAAVLRICETESVPCLAPKIVASTVESGLMGFWKDLDRNITPLAATIREILSSLALEDPS